MTSTKGLGFSVIRSQLRGCLGRSTGGKGDIDIQYAEGPNPESEEPVNLLQACIQGKRQAGQTGDCHHGLAVLNPGIV
jgi:hypothetical protein